MEKINIGNSDYSREEMEQGLYGFGTSAKEFLNVIMRFEKDGYQVKFETSIWRKIFSSAIYKVVAYR